MRTNSLLRATAAFAGALVLLTANGAGAAVSPTQALLTRVGILPGDLQKGFTVKLVPGGAALTDPSFDNCNYSFTTEAQRTARRQLRVVAPNGVEAPIGSEAVAYKTPAAAAKAMVEWRASVAGCKPLTWMKGKVPSDDVRIDSASNRTDLTLPIKDNTDTNILFRPRGAKVSYRVLIISQRKGNVITTVLVYTAAKPVPGDVAALQFLAKQTGQRMAAAVR